MIYQQDMLKLDALRITDEKHPIFGDMTVFHDVVIASEIVHPYNDGRAWKPKEELESYAPYVEGAWVIVGSHPVDGIISERDQVSGRTINSRYVKDLLDPKKKRPNRAGVRADVQLFNNKIPPTTLEDMRNGKKQDVSIGFFFTKDEVAGIVADGPFKGEEYDYIQRNMFHNHLAAGIDNGRCPSPICGLSADEVIKQLIGDPFAGFSSFENCVSEMTKPKSEGGQGYSEETAKKVCGKLKSEHEDILMEDAVLGKSKERITLLLEEAYEELRGTILAKKEQATGDWWRRIDWSEENNRPLYDSLNEDTRNLITEAGLCPDCQDEELPYEDGEPLEFTITPVSDKEEEEKEEEEEESEEEEKKKKKDALDPYKVLERFNRLSTNSSG
jgi:hypothetical protein